MPGADSYSRLKTLGTPYVTARENRSKAAPKHNFVFQPALERLCPQAGRVWSCKWEHVAHS
jgi:hypothetical protein